MDIVVGAVKGVSIPDGGGRKDGGVVEGLVLAIRMPRGSGGAGRQAGGPAGSAGPGAGPGKDRISGDERRRRRDERRGDPPGSRVLTLLVPDPSGLPADAESVSYRVILRFIRQT